jgi:RimJ/RimL family protein N-acetyltransferase
VIEIRRLTAADAPAFRALRLEALQAYPADFGSEFEEQARLPVAYFVAQLLDNHVMGAFAEGQLMGIMALEFRSAAKTRHRAFLWGVYVRTRGVAPALLDATLAVGFEAAEQIELGVRVGNPAAERLYASRGFVRYGIEPRSHRVGRVDHDDALMVAYRPAI